MSELKLVFLLLITCLSILIIFFSMPTNSFAADITVSASSQESEELSAKKLLDGNATTRWSSQFSEPQWLLFDLGSSQEIIGLSLQWEAAFGKSYDILISPDNATWSKIYSTTQGQGASEQIYFGKIKTRYLKLDLKERGTQFGFSLFAIQFHGPEDDAKMRSSHKSAKSPASRFAVTASSQENESLGPENVFDHSLTTRWASQFSDSAWLLFDLLDSQAVLGVTLVWEAAYAKAYTILISNDKANWTPVYSTKTGHGLIEDLYFGKKTARYIKIEFQERGTAFGYSLFEVRFKGAENELKITASSSAAAHPPDLVFDNDLNTSWKSDPNATDAWLEIDLHKPTNLGGLQLSWDENHADTYSLEAGNEIGPWTKIFTNQPSPGGNEQIIANIVQARYLRIICHRTPPATGFGIRDIQLKTWEDLAAPSSLISCRGLVGWENFKWKTFVGRDGCLAPEPHDFALAFWLYDQDRKQLFTPETMPTQWHLSEGGVPISIVEWKTADFSISTTVFAHLSNPPELYCTFARTTIKNNSTASKNFTLLSLIRPNPLKAKTLDNVALVNRSLLYINDKAALFSKTGSAESLTERLKTSLEAFGNFNILCDQKNSTANSAAALPFTGTLKPGESVSYDFIASNQEPEAGFPAMDFIKYQELTRAFWAEKTSLKLILPDPRFTDCFFASIYYILILMENNQLQPGPAAYRSFFLHDGVDMLTALDKVGLNQTAASCLPAFNYKPGDHYLDGLGGDIFSHFEHYRLTHDQAYLAETYPQLIEKANMIKNLRQAQLQPEFKGTALFGLLPKSASQDNFKFPAYLYLDNWWGLIGLKSCLLAAQALHKTADQTWLASEYQAYHSALLQSISRVMKNNNLDVMPGFADFWPPEMRQKDNDHRILGDTQMAWAHRPALFPGQSLGINLPKDLFIKSYKHYWEKAGKFSNYDGGWFVEYEQLFWGYNVMISQPLLFLGLTELAFKSIAWNVDHQSCPGGWMEAMNTRENETGLREITSGIVGDVPHGWVASHYIHFLRNMLLREAEDKIILLSGVPEAWLKSEKPIQLENAPTYFGSLNLSYQRLNNSVTIKVWGLAKPKQGFEIPVLPYGQTIGSIRFNQKPWNKKADQPLVFQTLPAEIQLELAP